MRFIALLSALCRTYHWPPDFWRKMGRNEFFAWVDQVNREQDAKAEQADSWEGSKQDDGWQKMREKRDRLRGR